MPQGRLIGLAVVPHIILPEAGMKLIAFIDDVLDQNRGLNHLIVRGRTMFVRLVTQRLVSYPAPNPVLGFRAKILSECEASQAQPA